LVHSITTHGWYGTVQASLTRKVDDRHVLVNGHTRVEAARLANLTHVPVEFADLPEYQEQQLSVALDNPYGHWDQAKLATRLHGLEVQHLDMDALCLPPFDVSRILQQPVPQTVSNAFNPAADGVREVRTGIQIDGSEAAQGPQNPSVLQSSGQKTTGAAGLDTGYTLTMKVTATDELLDMLIDVHAAAKLWRDNGLEVIIGE